MKNKKGIIKFNFLNNLTKRYVAQCTLYGMVNEIKHLCKKVGLSLDDINDLEEQVDHFMWKIKNGTNKLVNIYNSSIYKKNKKLFITENKTDPYFNLVLSIINNEEPNYIKYFEENCLNFFSTEKLF